MPSATGVKRLTISALPSLALLCALFAAAASAHGDRHGNPWHVGFRDDEAVVTGTITSLGSGSFGAGASELDPGAGNAGSAPALAAVTLVVGPATRVVTPGRSGLAVGDSFYAIYDGVSDTTPLSTLAGDTPAAVYAYASPAPEVEVKGVVTSAPAGGSDSFTATTFVVAPRHFSPTDGAYSYGGHVGGKYGYGPSSSHGRRTHSMTRSQTVGTVGSPNTTITTDASTRITLEGQSSSVSNLAVGDMFVAIYNGIPSEPLSTITATPAISIRAWSAPTGNALYGFVGTVAGTASGTVTVNVTASVPTGMFSGADTFTVGSQTKVVGNTNLGIGDVVAGALIAPSGQSASTVASTPLQLLVDYPPASSSPASATAEQIKRAERRALEMLRAEQAKLARHHEKHLTHRS